MAVQVRPLNRDIITDFKGYVTGLPEVLSVFVLAGGDDFLVHVAVPDIEHLHESGSARRSSTSTSARRPCNRSPDR